MSLISTCSTVWYHQEPGMNYRKWTKRVIAIIPNAIPTPSPIKPPLELASLDFAGCSVATVEPVGIAADVTWAEDGFVATEPAGVAAGACGWAARHAQRLVIHNIGRRNRNICWHTGTFCSYGRYCHLRLRNVAFKAYATTERGVTSVGSDVAETICVSGFAGRLGIDFVFNTYFLEKSQSEVSRVKNGENWKIAYCTSWNRVNTVDASHEGKTNKEKELSHLE